MAEFTSYSLIVTYWNEDGEVVRVYRPRLYEIPFAIRYLCIPDFIFPFLHFIS